MKKLIVAGIFILAIFFVGFFTASLSGGTVVSRVPEEVNEAFKSVVEVHVTVVWRGELELKGGGSGFFVASDHVLTCPHIASQFHQVVMDPETEIEVEVGGKIFLAQIVAVDWRRELMLLKVENAPQVPVVKLAQNVKKDEIVFITGYISVFLKSGRQPYISAPAFVESIDEKGKTGESTPSGRAMERYRVTKLLTIYGRSGNGVSGGPVFNTDGEVVGLAWLIDIAGDYVFATPVDVIREFLKEHLKEENNKNG